jgi:hypothetical protein
MNIEGIPYEIFDLEKQQIEEHSGESGKAYWKTINRGNIRIRIVEYSKGYLADHWCKKGHVVFILEGSVESELKDGKKDILKKGMGYIVGDNLSEHRSYSETGVKMLIVD